MSVEFEMREGDGRNKCKICDESLKGRRMVRFCAGKGNMGNPIMVNLCSSCLLKMATKVCKGKEMEMLAQVI